MRLIITFEMWGINNIIVYLIKLLSLISHENLIISFLIFRTTCNHSTIIIKINHDDNKHGLYVKLCESPE